MRRSRLHFDIFAEDNSGRAFSSLQSRLSQSEKQLATVRKQFVAVSAAATAFGAAVVAATRQGMSRIDDQAKAARRLGTSVDGLRAVQIVASEAGVSLSRLTDDLQTMGRELVTADEEGGRAARALARLGLRADDLRRMDADQRLAAISEQVRTLSIDTDEASKILQELGIRNREMVLLLMEGADAFRDARSAVDRYGLSLSEVDTRRVEEANDAINRMGFAAEVAGNRLAVALSPALNNVADGFLAALQEGGRLRESIEFLGRNIEGMLRLVGFVVTAFGVRYVGALATARIATIQFTSATVAARSAVIALGGPIGLLWGLIGAGAAAALVYRDNLGEAEAATHDAEAATAALNTALGTFYQTAAPSAAREAINTAAANRQLAAAARDAAASELARAEAMAAAAGRGGMAGPGARGQAQADADLAEARENLERAEAALARANREADRAARSVTGTMSDRMSDAFDATSNLRFEIEGLSEALDSVGGARAGGSAASATEGITAMGSAVEQAEFRINRFEDASRRAFVSFVTGADSARQAASRLLDSFANILADQAFSGLSGLFGGLFGGGGSLASGFSGGQVPGMYASGTSSAARGLAWVGERGPELVNFRGGEQVFDAQTSQRMASGGQSTVRVELGEGLVGSILSQAEGQTVKIVRAGVKEYDRELPRRVQQIGRDPRRMG